MGLTFLASSLAFLPLGVDFSSPDSTEEDGLLFPLDLLLFLYFLA